MAQGKNNLHSPLSPIHFSNRQQTQISLKQTASFKHNLSEPYIRQIQNMTVPTTTQHSEITQ